MQQRSSNLPLYKILAIIEKKVFIYLHSLLTAADHYFKKIYICECYLLTSISTSFICSLYRMLCIMHFKNWFITYCLEFRKIVLHVSQTKQKWT